MAIILFAQLQETAKRNLQKRMMKQMQSELKDRQKQYLISKWVAVQIAKKIKYNYFKDIKAYMKYR